MAKLTLVNLVLLTLLSATSGIAKIMLLPQEVEFFGSAGFTQTSLMLFGVAQLTGGIFLIFNRMRVAGAAIMTVTFVASTILIFMDGKIAFGIFSLLPALMAVLVIRTTPARA